MSAGEHEKPTVDSLGVEGQFVGEVDEQPHPGSANPTTAGAPLVEGQPERKPIGRSRRKWLAGLALAVLTVSGVIFTNLVGLIDVYKFLVGDPPGAGSSPDPIATAPTTAVPPPPTESWTDTFADDRIDPAWWALNSRPELIYERGGVLNLEVPQAATSISNSDGGNPHILALPEGRQIAEFAFTLTLESIANNDSGGTGGALFDAVGREYSAYVGSGSDVHHVEFATCVPGGPDGEQCTSMTGPVITIGEPTQIRIAWSDDEIEVYAGSSVPRLRGASSRRTGASPVRHVRRR